MGVLLVIAVALSLILGLGIVALVFLDAYCKLNRDVVDAQGDAEAPYVDTSALYSDLNNSLWML
jgi:hypothetical protein